MLAVPGGALTTFPCKCVPIFFSALRRGCTGAPPGYTYATRSMVWCEKYFDIFNSCITHRYIFIQIDERTDTLMANAALNDAARHNCCTVDYNAENVYVSFLPRKQQ